MVKHEVEKNASMDAFKSAKRVHVNQGAESNRRNGIYVGISSKIAAKEKVVTEKQAYLKTLEEKLKKSE